MNVSPILLASTFTVLLLYVLRSRLGVLTVLQLRLMFAIVGLIQLHAIGIAEFKTVMYFAVGSIVLLVSAYIAGRVVRQKRPSTSRQIPPLSEPTVALACTAVLIFTTYHFAVAGVPILSSDIERSRFDIAASGLFGLPGRAYQYGMPLCLTLTAANASAHGIPWSRYRPFKVMLAASILVAAMSGFKGALIDLVITLVILNSTLRAGGPRVGRVLVRFFIPLAACGFYFFYTALQYRTYQSRAGSLSEQLLERATIGGARPIVIVMESDYWWTKGNPQIHDFAHFGAKYVGVTPDDYGFTRAASAAMWGVDPASDHWTPPVTLSGFGELHFAFGPYLAVIGMALIGILIGHLEHRTRTTIYGGIADVTILLACVDFIVKGGFSFIALNTSITLAVFSICLRIAHAFTKGTASSAPELSLHRTR